MRLTFDRSDRSILTDMQFNKRGALTVYGLLDENKDIHKLLPGETILLSTGIFPHLEDGEILCYKDSQGVQHDVVLSETGEIVYPVTNNTDKLLVLLKYGTKIKVQTVFWLTFLDGGWLKNYPMGNTDYDVFSLDEPLMEVYIQGTEQELAKEVEIAGDIDDYLQMCLL